MGKYFLLQIKRFFRMLPMGILVSTVLLCGLLVALNGVMKGLEDPDAQTRVTIAVAGEPEDSLLQTGLSVLRSMDSSRFAVDVISMEEKAAEKALESGEIGAYVVIPEGFMESALHGRVKTLKFVSTVGAAGLVSMFKTEITAILSDMVMACQKGMFGAENAFAQAQLSKDSSEHIHRLTLDYAEFVLLRSRMYQVEELGLADKLGMEGRALCGIFVLLLTLTVLPFSALLVKVDLSVECLLASKGRGLVGRTLCEYGGFLLSFCLQLLCSCGIVAAVMKLLSVDGLDGIGLEGSWQLFLVVAMITAFSYMLFAMCSDMIGGVLLPFFAGVFLCFAGGCIYPVSFFPETMQSLAEYLPQGLARSVAEGWMLGTGADKIGLLLIYTGSFLAIVLWIKMVRLREGKV